MKNDYVKRINEARVYDVAKKTPLEFQTHLSSRFHNQIFLKREDLQPVFSFKLRGAYNKMAGLSKPQLDKGVITASAGNHARRCVKCTKTRMSRCDRHADYNPPH